MSDALPRSSRPNKPLSPPFLKWPGGKRRLAQSIISLVPEKYNDYYEPFLGSGALFFALGPARAFLSDRNSDLISAYKEVRNNPELLIARLRKFRNTERHYYTIRSARLRNEASKAARLIYLSRLSFNGIHRVNLRGEFNVPYGHKTHLPACEPEVIRAASQRLRKATIRAADFEAAVSEAKTGDLVYLDPPYTTAHSNNGFVKYNARIFTWRDQERLANVASRLARRGCSVIISNADHPSIRNLYKGFRAVKIARFSVIAASRLYRRRITECVFSNT